MNPVEIEITPPLEDLVDHVKKGQCILFLGAGIHASPSEGSPYSYSEEQRPPLGGDLASQMALECGFDKKFPGESPRDLQRISLWFETTLGRMRLVNALKTHLKDGKKPSPALI